LLELLHRQSAGHFTVLSPTPWEKALSLLFQAMKVPLHDEHDPEEKLKRQYELPGDPSGDESSLREYLVRLELGGIRETSILSAELARLDSEGFGCRLAEALREEFPEDTKTILATVRFNHPEQTATEPGPSGAPLAATQSVRKHGQRAVAEAQAPLQSAQPSTPVALPAIEAPPLAAAGPGRQQADEGVKSATDSSIPESAATPVQGTTTAPSAAAAIPSSPPDPEAVAIALLWKRPDLTLPQIAKAVNVQRQTLYKWPKFLEAAEAVGKYTPKVQKGEGLPSGSKSRDGTVEAWRDHGSE
jgi:hypothetical protein